MPCGGGIIAIITTSFATTSRGSAICTITALAPSPALGPITTARHPSAASRAQPPIAARTAAGIRAFESASRARRYSASYAGLTRVSITLRKSLEKRMDCRVKPGNDGHKSLVADPHLFHHARVFGELFAGQSAQLLGRAAAHCKAEVFEFGADFRIANGLEYFPIESGNNLLRRAGRCKNRKPGIEEETR